MRCLSGNENAAYVSKSYLSFLTELFKLPKIFLYPISIDTFLCECSKFPHLLFTIYFVMPEISFIYKILKIFIYFNLSFLRNLKISEIISVS